MNPHRFARRAIQLDLARQPETCAFVKSFIDFISRWSYNTLVLYLEGRVRTPSFHALPEEESYSQEQIRDLVAYAAEKGIETIPVVSMFGHAELFLERPAFEHLAELRGGITGRFNTFRHVFCPSLPETLEFLERYTAEVAALFPSEYFHAGFDETWDIGYCDLCRKRLEEESGSGIFRKHLLACHKIVTEKLGKKMMIWDDMFDMYPDVLDDVPRDVILCPWHYETLVEKPFGHIGTPRTDVFAKYEKMGFHYLFAPATHFCRNMETFTRYAEKYHPDGALLTSWGIETPLQLPIVAAAGKLWAEGSVDIPAVIREVSCTEDETICRLIRSRLDAEPVPLAASAQAYLKGPLSETEFTAKLRNDVEFLLLGAKQNEAIKEAASLFIGREKLYFALRDLIPRWFGFSTETDTEETLKNALQEQRQFTAALQERMEDLRERCLCTRNAVDKARDLTPVIAMIDKLLTEPRPAAGAYLRMRFPWTSTLSVSLRLKGESAYRTIWNGGCSQRPFRGEFQVFVPLECNGIPESLLVEQHGYVNAPLSYLEIAVDGRLYIPLGLAGIEGKVYSPVSVLEDGRDWCLFGEGEELARRKFRTPLEAKALNRIVVLLKESV